MPDPIPARMKVVEQTDELLLIALAGDLDSTGVAAIEGELGMLATATTTDTIIDLSEVEFIASLGLSMIVMCRGAVRKHDRQLILAGATGGVHDVLTRGRFDSIVTIVEDVESARATLAR